MDVRAVAAGEGSSLVAVGGRRSLVGGVRRSRVGDRRIVVVVGIGLPF